MNTAFLFYIWFNAGVDHRSLHMGDNKNNADCTFIDFSLYLQRHTASVFPINILPKLPTHNTGLLF